MSIINLMAIRLIVVVSIYYAAFDCVHSILLFFGAIESMAFFAALFMAFAAALNQIYIVKGLTWKAGFWE